jgi:dipeptidase D
MNSEIRNLEPKTVWKNFADLNAVPRPSKKKKKSLLLWLILEKN